MAEGIQIVEELRIAEPSERLILTEDRERHVEPKATILPDDLHIFLREQTLRDIVVYAKSDLRRELGGVLIGTFHRWNGKLWVDVAGEIKARQYHHTAASFTFTHDSWSEISREKERRYEDRPVVGWYHTHPGLGIFLSGHDRFIQEEFFDLPYQVALVVDPRAETFGFYQWKRGKIAPCGLFFVK